VPRRVVVLDSLPRSLIGKVLRREIRDNLVSQG
jgi:long-chain acyl-CoA synthetase